MSPSTHRYRAAKADVEKRVSYAFASGQHENPFPVDDRRHGWFARRLRDTFAVDADFRDLHEAHGGDLSELHLHQYPALGQVLPYLSLA
ncbi:hypothetical protein F6X40_27885 [Paraburkholderia sp. UCT31]|uniref:hypothetical protein n=1 Tax=Paraburkholderia sp. UCT31 TaxID=2615209 RepID=UPI0016553785|nr:hypothetical protein [Paraburkholderia sp. UCT31]MBC8740461.1 hypothetical protein [Paraburkholderia sp. UCT31]